MRYSDREIIAAIQNGSHRLDPYIRELYQTNFGKVNRYIQTHHGKEENAEDVMQQAMIKLIENVEARKFRGESSLSSYLYAMCRNIWMDNQRKDSKFTPMTEATAEHLSDKSEDPLGFLIREDLKQQVVTLLGKIDEKCRKVLIWSDVDGRPMKWIAQSMGYSVQAAMNKKSKCRKTIRNKILENPIYRRLAEEIIAYN